MRLSAVTAARHAAAAGFVLIHREEERVLDTLPLWYSALWRVLVRLSSFRTGHGRTTIAELIERLTPIQPRTGKRHYVPDRKAIERAVATLEGRGILRRNAHANVQAQALFFSIDPRGAKFAHSPNVSGECVGGVNVRKPSNGAGSSPMDDGMCRGNLSGPIQEYFLSIGHPEDNLSTPSESPAHRRAAAREEVRRIIERNRAAGRKK
jgi:hypothetical protein